MILKAKMEYKKIKMNEYDLIGNTSSKIHYGDNKQKERNEN